LITRNSPRWSAVARLRPVLRPAREDETERGRSGLVERPPVGSGARAGCGRGRAAPGCSMSLLMSSRGPAANLRPISRSTSPSARANRPASSFACLNPRPSVKRVKARAPPNVWRHSPHPSPVLSPRQHQGCNLQIRTACCVRARVELHKRHLAASIATSCAAHPGCPSHEPSSDRVFGSSAFPRRTGRQYPDCQ
jgi:hypothetical protein